jgi:hypothetical protein
MKKLITKLLPISIKNTIKHNLMICNFFNANYKKRALLSYVITPFKLNSLSHTYFYEAQSWAKILDELGYIVDIIDYRNTKKLDIEQYDLICGFGSVFKQYFESSLDKKIKTIYYGTGMHMFFQNQATLQRVKEVFNKKNVWLGKSARVVENTSLYGTFLADSIIILGNDIVVQSYKKYYNGNIFETPAPFYQVQNAISIISRRSKESTKHYLWIGGSGLIHKGLDLILEYFSKHQNLILHICGPIDNEKDFINAYNTELFKTSNILVHGFVDINSKQFEEILLSCSFVIFPSCSEGGAASVLAAIGNGGLIPIITKETSINTGYEIWIDKLNNKYIHKAISESQNLTYEAIKELQIINYKFVLENHSQDVYYATLKNNIKKSLSEI